MQLLPVVYKRRLPPIPAPVVRVLREGGRVMVAVAGAMADQAFFLMAMAAASLARIVWWFGTLAFIGAGGMFIVFWFYGRPWDALAAVYQGMLALGLMAGSAWVGGLYHRYRFGHGID